MVDESYGKKFTCKTDNDTWEPFKDLIKNSQWHASSFQFDALIYLGGRSLHEVSHALDSSFKVDALSQKFDQLLSMNCVPMNVSSVKYVCFVCVTSHAFIY